MVDLKSGKCVTLFKNKTNKKPQLYIVENHAEIVKPIVLLTEYVY